MSSEDEQDDQEEAPLAEPLPFITAKTLARKILEEGVYTFRDHANLRLDERDMTHGDVTNVLRGGNCVEHVFEKGTYRYRFETPRGYNVVIAFRSSTELVVITAWKK